jgi:two-component system, cell cycle sensor histidine kinase and response regulator CckA
MVEVKHGAQLKPAPDSPSSLIVVVLVLAILASLAGGAWFYRLQQHAMLSGIEKKLTAIARIKTDHIIAWRKDQLADAAMHNHPFMKHSVTRFLSEPNENNRQDLLLRFLSLVNQHDYADVLLVSPDGKTLLRLSDSETIHHGYLSAVDTALRERRPVFVDLHVEQDHNTPHISVVAPLWAASDEVQKALGALVFIIDASQFLFPLIQSWPIPSDTAETLLVRRDGDHVLFLNNLRHRPDTALNLRIPLSRTDLPAVMAVQGRHGFVQGTDYREADVAAVILPVSESPWFMVSKIDAREAFADWRSRSFLLLVMIFGWTTLVGVVGLVFWQRAKKVHFFALYRSEADLRAQMERHSVTLKAVGDAVIATDTRGRVELLNPVAETLTGWRQDDAVGRALEEVFNIISALTREKAENPVARVLREGLVVGLANHTILISRDGREFQIADSAAPITDPAGDITGVVMVFRDVTSEYAMQQALVDAERYYRSLIHSLHEDILVIDHDYRVTDINNSALQTLGLKREQAMGRHCYELSHGLDSPCHMHEEECGLRHVLETGTGCNLHHEHVDTDGKRRHVDILTSPLKDQNKNITHVIEAVRDVTDLFESREAVEKAEDALIESEKRYRRLFESAKDGILILDADTGMIVDVNPFILDLLGYTYEAFVGRHLWDIGEFKDIVASRISLQELQAKGYIRYEDLPLQTRDGSRIHVEFVSNVYLVDNQKIIQCNIRNITERKQAEMEREKLQAQLLQAQKMESVGRLAGGVAHDFNNMLGVILGHTELALLKVDEDSDLISDLNEIQKAATRSADITKQLLAFARKEIISPKQIDLNDTLESMLNMLRRLIGEDIDLVWQPGAHLWPVKMDPSQIDQILANLCVNARDAIAGVGKLTIETGKKTFDEEYCNDHLGFIPGDFVLLAVSDNGCGMNKDTLDNLFEPFFTTKEMGKGTGLGLATVYGIVKQNNGFINVYSEPGQGSTFKIYLPRLVADKDVDKAVPVKTAAAGGYETILLVEDEPTILKMTRMMLEKKGYSVLTAAAPAEAMNLARTHSDKIHILITDVVMPGMNGRDLAGKITDFYPDIGLLFMSGYTANVIAHHGVLDDGVAFIQKPFSMADMTAKVREVLDKT